MIFPSERWLQTIWGRTDWCGWSLSTNQGDRLHVLSPGQWNPDQGPDFLGAQIFIGQVLWVGAVELHVLSSDWFLHRHPHDPHYLPVVLHVVWKLDRRNPELPTLELSRFISNSLLRRRFTQLLDIAQLPCQPVMRPVDQLVWENWRASLLRQRANRKWERFRFNHPTSIRTALARQLGSWVNRDVFESIDASIPEELFGKIRFNLDWITALYLGQGGLLPAQKGKARLEYFSAIYQQMRKSFQINPPYRQLLWMRIRPAANPIFRLLQLATLVHAGWAQTEKWNQVDPEYLKMEWRSLPVHELLSELKDFNIGVPAPPTTLSEGLINGLLINIWAYLNATNLNELKDHLAVLPFEDNRITRMFHGLDLNSPTALDSQAMLELNMDFCSRLRCGTCSLASCWIHDQAPQSI